MLRLTWTRNDDRGLTLLAEGQLVGEWGDLLELETVKRHSGAQKIGLDLSRITYVDKRGIDVLLRMKARGIDIVGQSSLITDILSNGGWR